MKSYNRSTSGRSVLTQRNGSTTTVTESTGVAEQIVLVTGIQNPGNFRDPTAFSFTRSQHAYQSGSIWSGFTTSTNFIQVEGQLGYGSNPQGQTTGFSTEAYNRALEKLYTQLRGELDLSIDLLQARQVRSSMDRGVRTLRNLADLLRRMKREPTKVASEMWLEWTYGIKPTVSSIYDTVKLFENGARTGLITVKSRSKEVSRRTVSWNSIGDANLLSRTDESTSRRCQFVCEYGISDSVLNNLASLSSLNPVSIAWELVPYSFVVDWFVDIGGYVRNFESALLYAPAFKRGYTTQGYLIEGTTITAGQYVSGIFSRRVSCRGSYRLSGMSRSVLSSSPTPRLPRFKVDLGANRLLSAAALLRQRL